MNEKIVELLTKQGFLDNDGDPVTDFKPRHLVDLIESVIQECARIADVYSEEGAEWSGGSEICRQFGVTQSSIWGK